MSAQSACEEQQWCTICGGVPDRIAADSPDGIYFFLCERCDTIYFDGVTPRRRVALIQQAIACTRKHGVNLEESLNVVSGRYSLAEAQRRYRLFQREAKGHRPDFYHYQQRLPGSFESRR